MTANVLSPGVAAAIPIKSRHGFDRTDIKRLAEHVSGLRRRPLPSLIVPHIAVSRHCYASASSVAFAQLYEPQGLDNAKLAASLLTSSVRLP